MRAFIAALGMTGLLAATLPATAAEPEHRVIIEYKNLATGQGLSSAPFVAHKAGLHLWQMGKPASLGVRLLAEEGNPEWIAGAAVSNHDHAYGDGAIATPALAGQTRQIELTVTEQYPNVSGGFMLGQTNDGFAGIDAVDALHLTHAITLDVYPLDAGTSKNLEDKQYLRALGGFGREAENAVIKPHPGLSATAEVPAAWRFDPTKPIARVTITPVSKTGTE